MNVQEIPEKDIRKDPEFIKRWKTNGQGHPPKGFHSIKIPESAGWNEVCKLALRSGTGQFCITRQMDNHKNWKFNNYLVVSFKYPSERTLFAMLAGDLIKGD